MKAFTKPSCRIPRDEVVRSIRDATRSMIERGIRPGTRNIRESLVGMGIQPPADGGNFDHEISSAVFIVHGKPRYGFIDTQTGRDGDYYSHSKCAYLGPIPKL